MTKLRLSGYTPGEEMNGLNAAADEFTKPEPKRQPVIVVAVIDVDRAAFSKKQDDVVADLFISRIEPIMDPAKRDAAIELMTEAYDARQHHAALTLPATEQSDATEKDGE